MGYEKGKIYKLECEDRHFYIGSTIAELKTRLQGHKRASRTQPYRVYKHINAIGWDKVKIILIAEFSCESRKELCAKENEYIKEYKNSDLCLNTIVAFHTEESRKKAVKECYQKNIEKRRAYEKKRSKLPERKESVKKNIEKNKDKYLESKRRDYMKHKEARDAKTKENYYKKREEILAKKRQRYHESKQ